MSEKLLLIKRVKVLCLELFVLYLPVLYPLSFDLVGHLSVRVVLK